MDIWAYEDLLKGMRNYNDMLGKPRGNVIVKYSTENSTYPHTIFSEIRNVDYLVTQRVASVGYRITVCAKTKGNIDKETIAREVAEKMDKFLTSKKLRRISYNGNPQVNDSSIYQIDITYSGNLDEFRRIYR